MIEMFEVMSELEGCAHDWLRAVSATSSSSHWNRLNKECENAIEADDSDLYYRKNVEFHECIYSACGNGFLAEETRSLGGDFNLLGVYNCASGAVCHSH